MPGVRSTPLRVVPRQDLQQEKTPGCSRQAVGAPQRRAGSSQRRLRRSTVCGAFRSREQRATASDPPDMMQDALMTCVSRQASGWHQWTSPASMRPYTSLSLRTLTMAATAGWPVIRLR